MKESTPESKENIFKDGLHNKNVKTAILFGLFLTVFLVILGVFYYQGWSVGDKFFSKEIITDITDRSVSEEVVVAPTSTPRPTGPGTYACSPSGVCNEYDDPTEDKYDCPVTFADRYCLDSCDIEENRCSN